MRRATAMQFLFAGCLGLSPSILSQFTLKMCVTAGNRNKNSLKPYFGGSRSSTLTPIKSLSLFLVMISSMSVPICNRFQATRDNCGKTSTF